MIEIQPASLVQVVNSDRHNLVEVGQDVLDVVAQLKQIDPDLHVFYDEHEEFFVVEHHVHNLDGSVDENLVLTAQQLDQRIVERVRFISSSSYDFVAEGERMEDEARKREERLFSEQRAPVLEELAHALRKDLGLKRNF